MSTIIERDVVLQSKDETGNPTIDFPVTRLGLVEDTAEIKAAPAAGDYIPVVDSANGGQMKKMLWSAITALFAAVGHKHSAAEVGAAAASHGTHVSYSTTAPVMDGTASAGSAATVARSDHKHPTDSSRAAANHTHTAAEVGARPSTWTPTAAEVGAAAASHGTHVSYSTTAPVMDGTASAGSAATVARSDHKHPTDSSRAAANHTHTAAEVGARPSTWTPTAADVGALASGGTAAAATKLATARTFRTNLGSTSTASFNGTANVTPGVTGTLPIANGGTGATTAAAALAALGAAPASHTHTEAVVVGTYTGDGAETRVIDLGFRPKMVLVFPRRHVHYREYAGGYELYGGMAADGYKCKLSGQSVPGIEVVDQGFQVGYKIEQSSNGSVSYKTYTNTDRYTYHYVAFR